MGNNLQFSFYFIFVLQICFWLLAYSFFVVVVFFCQEESILSSMMYYFYCIENNKASRKDWSPLDLLSRCHHDNRLEAPAHNVNLYEFYITLICPSARFTKILHLLFLEGNETQKAKLEAWNTLFTLKSVCFLDFDLSPFSPMLCTLSTITCKRCTYANSC